MLDFAAMAISQQSDQELQVIQSSSSSSLKFTDIPIEGTETNLVCDTSTGVLQPCVPKGFLYQEFELLHSLSHPVMRATQRLVNSSYIWPNMSTDVRKWTCSCVQCQRAKVQQHTVSPHSTFTTPDVHFDYIHIDIVGPLPPSNCYSYILTCIDRFTCWTEALPSSGYYSCNNCQNVRKWIDFTFWNTFHYHN